MPADPALHGHQPARYDVFGRELPPSKGSGLRRVLPRQPDITPRADLPEWWQHPPHARTQQELREIQQRELLERIKAEPIQRPKVLAEHSACAHGASSRPFAACNCPLRRGAQRASQDMAASMNAGQGTDQVHLCERALPTCPASRRWPDSPAWPPRGTPSRGRRTRCPRRSCSRCMPPGATWCVSDACRTWRPCVRLCSPTHLPTHRCQHRALWRPRPPRASAYPSPWCWRGGGGRCARRRGCCPTRSWTWWGAPRRPRWPTCPTLPAPPWATCSARGSRRTGSASRRRRRRRTAGGRGQGRLGCPPWSTCAPWHVTRPRCWAARAPPCWTSGSSSSPPRPRAQRPPSRRACTLHCPRSCTRRRSALGGRRRARQRRGACQSPPTRACPRSACMPPRCWPSACLDRWPRTR